MITEDYISFETAKLLKEKGFMDGAIVKFFASGYNKNGHILSIRDTELDDYPRPTLQMATKWLRKNFNMNPVPYATSIGWYFEVFDLTQRDVTGCALLYQVGIPSKEKTFETCEEACEAGIRYCLENLI
jgi:hypothetical protein